MELQHGCIISDVWLPNGISTGIMDINGVEIKTCDWVKMSGCRERKAIVGINAKSTEDKKRFSLYFGSEIGSTGWELDKETVLRHSLTVIK